MYPLLIAVVIVCSFSFFFIFSGGFRLCHYLSQLSLNIYVVCFRMIRTRKRIYIYIYLMPDLETKNAYYMVRSDLLLSFPGIFLRNLTLSDFVGPDRN